MGVSVGDVDAKTVRVGVGVGDVLIDGVMEGVRDIVGVTDCVNVTVGVIDKVGVIDGVI